MSDWNTHLYCASKVNEVLGFKGKELDMFFYGNIFPDINIGWIITPEVKIDHTSTHFDDMGQGYFWSPSRFFDKYKEEILSGNPLLLGYLFHIWLDVKFMTDFVDRLPMSLMIDKKYLVREYKWKDARFFIKKYQFTLEKDNIDAIVEASKLIEEVNVTSKDLNIAADFVNNSSDAITSDSYYVYSEDAFNEFYDEICEDFVNWIKEHNIVR